MTILNHITLEALARLPIAEIVALPAAELARLQHEADEALREAKLTVAWLDGDEDNRRHWHNACWSKRNNRRPNTERTRNAPRY